VTIQTNRILPHLTQNTLFWNSIVHRSKINNLKNRKVKKAQTWVQTIRNSVITTIWSLNLKSLLICRLMDKFSDREYFLCQIINNRHKNHKINFWIWMIIMILKILNFSTIISIWWVKHQITQVIQDVRQIKKIQLFQIRWKIHHLAATTFRALNIKLLIVSLLSQKTYF